MAGRHRTPGADPGVAAARKAQHLVPGAGQGDVSAQLGALLEELMLREVGGRPFALQAGSQVVLIQKRTEANRCGIYIR